MEDAAIPNPEAKGFDPSQFPDKTSCKVMPTENPHTRVIEVVDVRGNDSVAEVPAEAVIFMNVGQLLPDAARSQPQGPIAKAISENVGMGLLSCRVINSFEDRDVVEIEIPAVDGAISLEIAKNRLARKV